MIEGLSINGLWPAGLLVAVAVVLLTILAVRFVGGGGSKWHGPSHHDDRSQGRDHPTDPGHALEDADTRAELPIKTSHPIRGKNENRVLSRPTPASASASAPASTMAVLPQNHHPTGEPKQNQGKANVS
ncbi:hypothetical protein [Microcella pacifica]|uniref:Uncharacterized protein n=1 Tax=Microcella pacifica TaxID=2591847 RepID=A0A9E5JUH3_9MICO|nr:hypothetical protein [Microcella pacifica]NHF62668.1 hypothetical protein [Microcella pacifica]